MDALAIFERALLVIVIVGCCSATAALVWPLAWAVGRIRGEYGPAGQLCEMPRCHQPARPDTGRCEWHTATMPIGAARGKLRKAGYIVRDPAEIIPNRRRGPRRPPASGQPS